MSNGNKVFAPTEGLTEAQTTYCPGCGHGIVHRLVGEVLEEMGLLPKTIGVVGVGCSGMGYAYFNVDVIHAAHGRAAAVATGVRKVHPNKFVFTYQGDGDASAIGLAETLQSALRGERISVLVINNAIYGMTGGQASPTSIEGVPVTTPIGPAPLFLPEMIAGLATAGYVARGAIYSPGSIRRTKRLIRRSFEAQERGWFSLVEILAPCPVNWHLTPVESMSWIKEKMLQVFPVGEYQTRAIDGGE